MSLFQKFKASGMLRIRVVVSDRFGSEHYQRRIRWLRTAKTAEHADWLDVYERFICLDAGFPVHKDDIDWSTQILPAFHELCDESTNAAPLPDECPVCRDAVVDPVEIKACHHVFCHACLRAWAETVTPLTCPMCREPTRVSCRAFVRHGPVSLRNRMVEPDSVRQDRVREFSLAKICAEVRAQSGDAGKTLVISDWEHARRRYTDTIRRYLGGTNDVIVCNLTEALRRRTDTSVIRLVLMDTRDPITAVRGFCYDFPTVRYRFYHMSLHSLDEMLFRGGDIQPDILDQYCRYLQRKIASV